MKFFSTRKDELPMIPIIVAIGVVLIIAERLFPDQKLPVVQGWWFRVFVTNLLQLGVVILADQTWNHWFSHPVFSLKDHLAAPWAGLVCYGGLTFVFYWWHRMRHQVNFLWLMCHQLHHSPSRIETLTSFYKHPMELILNGVIIAWVNFGLFGLDIHGAAWVTLYTAWAEFFYHMNIKTPRWMGYFIQRPEMHRIHHRRGVHHGNFADLPLWDILFGTFQNPDRVETPCGFRPERENQFGKMLFFLNVNNPLSRGREK